MGCGAVVIVAALVLVGFAEVALGVNGVVVAPVGHRSHCYAHFENVAFAHAERGHESAKTPAPDANAVGVNVG